MKFLALCWHCRVYCVLAVFFIILTSVVLEVMRSLISVKNFLQSVQMGSILAVGACSGVKGCGNLSQANNPNILLFRVLQCLPMKIGQTYKRHGLTSATYQSVQLQSTFRCVCYVVYCGQLQPGNVTMYLDDGWMGHAVLEPLAQPHQGAHQLGVL